MKKLISFALCVVMLLTAIVPAYGAETTGVVNAPCDAVAK